VQAKCSGFVRKPAYFSGKNGYSQLTLFILYFLPLFVFMPKDDNNKDKQKNRRYFDEIILGVALWFGTVYQP
jgi:hypothetical protein